MKLLRVLFLLASFLPCKFAEAQTLAQPPKLIHFYSYSNPQQTYTFPIFSSVKAGDTLLAVIPSGAGTSITDPAETWALVPNTAGLWTAISTGAPVTVTI